MDKQFLIRVHQPNSVVWEPTTYGITNLRNDLTVAIRQLLVDRGACGVVFERWVTPEQADADLLRLAALN